MRLDVPKGFGLCQLYSQCTAFGQFGQSAMAFGMGGTEDCPALRIPRLRDGIMTFTP
jgi:hypothetical protein